MSLKRQHFFGFVCSPQYFTKVGEGCWIWNRATMKSGYGVIWYDGNQWLAHRLLYTFYKGPIPVGLTIDHLCCNTKCVNPDHLEAVPMGVNVLRSPYSISSVNQRKTHCYKGHEFTPENISKSGIGRQCRTCINARATKYRRERRITKDGHVEKL